MFNKALDIISDKWNIEAKQEQAEFFFCTSAAKEIVNGKKYFVIGRKGTGKTALSEFIVQTPKPNSFSERLSFKNFPFNELYSLENNKYTAPNQYITIWKFIIYSNICKMMARNENIDATLKNELEKLYPSDSKKSMSRMIEKWTMTDLSLSILGNALTGKRAPKTKEKLSWIEKCDVLEDVIQEYVDESMYYIVIDELDEDYRNFKSYEEKETYLKLMISLFKAVQDVRATFKIDCNIFPIIFLRSDIFSLLKDSDKNKWNSFKVDMDWNEDKIKEMLAFRLSKAFSKKDILLFDDAWKLLFDSKKVVMGNQGRRQLSKFDFIARSTQLRPRDYIQYIIECAISVKNEGEKKVTSSIVKNVDDKFSDYLLSELTDEIHAIIPEITEVFEILSTIRKQTFSTKEFIECYNEYVSSERIKDQGAENVLRWLFEFSIIGNQPKNIHNKAIFKYQSPNSRFNHKENVMIHRGLYKALQIY